MTPEAKLILFKKKVIKLGCKKEKTTEGTLAHSRGKRRRKRFYINEITARRAASPLPAGSPLAAYHCGSIL